MHGGPSRCPLGGGSANPNLTTFQRHYISRRLLYCLLGCPLDTLSRVAFFGTPASSHYGRPVGRGFGIDPTHCMPSRVRDVGVLGEGIGSLPARLLLRFGAGCARTVSIVLLSPWSSRWRARAWSGSWSRWSAVVKIRGFHCRPPRPACKSPALKRLAFSAISIGPPGARLGSSTPDPPGCRALPCIPYVFHIRRHSVSLVQQKMAG